jgi:molecular chaperone DnaK (HSP70)
MKKMNRAKKKKKKHRDINLSMASVLEIRVSFLDARNSQKLSRSFSRQKLERWCRKSLKSFGSCKRKTYGN